MKIPEETGHLLTSPEQIMDLAMAFQRSRILLAAFELGVFSAVGDSSLAAAEVAAKAGADARACERLLCALCAIGLMRKRSGLFSNTDAGKRFLVEKSGAYMAGLGHAANLYRSWGTLADAVRAGTAVQGRAPGERDGDSLRAFIAAMHRRAAETADTLVEKIDLSGVSRLLDVGGGSGVYSMAFARARRSLTAVVFDLPPVTELAGKYIAEAGLQDRIGTMGGNYLTDDLGEGFDVVFLSAVVHINSFEENRELARKAFRALNPGGRIVIQDFVMDEERTGPPMGAIFALNMLVNTPHGDTYTEREIREWLSSAGFADASRVDTGPATAMVIGVKPPG